MLLFGQKDIYSILYQLGAKIPQFKYPDDLIQEFKIWHHHFIKRNRFGGHNTPSMLMLLHIFLHRMKHEPYYNVQFLKSKKLHKRVVDIDETISGIRGSCSSSKQSFFDIRWQAKAVSRV